MGRGRTTRDVLRGCSLHRRRDSSKLQEWLRRRWRNRHWPQQPNDHLNERRPTDNRDKRSIRNPHNLDDDDNNDNDNDKATIADYDHLETARANDHHNEAPGAHYDDN
jgi:hypothetical protein